MEPRSLSRPIFRWISFFIPLFGPLHPRSNCFFTQLLSFTKDKQETVGKYGAGSVVSGDGALKQAGCAEVIIDFSYSLQQKCKACWKISVDGCFDQTTYSNLGSRIPAFT